MISKDRLEKIHARQERERQEKERLEEIFYNKLKKQYFDLLNTKGFTNDIQKRIEKEWFQEKMMESEALKREKEQKKHLVGFDFKGMLESFFEGSNDLDSLPCNN